MRSLLLRVNALFEFTQLPSGVYLYRLEAGGQVQSGKMVKVK